jgi:hypothetical protein
MSNDASHGYQNCFQQFKFLIFMTFYDVHMMIRVVTICTFQSLFNRNKVNERYGKEKTWNVIHLVTLLVIKET